MKRILSVGLAVIFLVAFAGFAAASSPRPVTIPTIRIVSVQPGVSVTVETANFPASQIFVVTMGKMGTKGVGGMEITTTSSGTGGTFTETYAIPPELQGEKLIAIRLESDEGFFSYNWFVNQPTATASPLVSTPTAPAPTAPAPTSPAATAQPGGFKIPTFEITDVIPDQQVTIQTSDFPANQVFQVTMGKIGTRGVNGVLVDKTDSAAGGSFSATYTIPPELIGQPRIAIRLQSAEGFFSYNWFENTLDTSNSVDTGSNPTATTTANPTSAPVIQTATATPAGTNPAISIVNVVKDQTVTIETSNFPPNQVFTVRMSQGDTAGVGGIRGDQVNSGTGGTFQVTFTIPAELAGVDRITIRLESSQGTFAYNTFDNQDTP